MGTITTHAGSNVAIPIARRCRSNPVIGSALAATTTTMPTAQFATHIAVVPRDLIDAFFLEFTVTMQQNAVEQCGI